MLAISTIAKRTLMRLPTTAAGVAAATTSTTAGAAAISIAGRRTFSSSTQKNSNNNDKNNNSKNSSNNNSNSSSSWSSESGILAMAATAALGGSLWSSREASCAASAENLFEKFKQSAVENYNNRIRAYSSPEKVFATFASVNKDGELHMTPDDFICSLMPMYGEGIQQRKKRKFRAGKSVPEVFRLADADGDGLLSFSEYIFFITLLSIPENHFSVAFAMFDLDGSGSIDQAEFRNFMEVMQQNSPSASRQRSSHVGLSNAAIREKRKEDEKEGNNNLYPMFFGADGKGGLTYSEFFNFLRSLQDATLQLEFDHFDRRSRGFIRGKDFAMTLITHVDPKLHQEYKQRADAPPHSKIKIDYRTFHEFNEFLRRIDELEIALDAYHVANGGDLDKESFCRAARAVAAVELPRELVDIVFHVFDRNGDGSLDKSEFIRVIQMKNGKGLRRSRDVGALRFFKCVASCVSDG